MATSYIGKPISLISHSDVRYRGILAGINPAQSTIQLENVWSMGTENRRPMAEFIPPAAQPYQYIVFRAAEVKDLAVEPVETSVPRTIHDDPAVLGASGGPQSMRSNDAYTPAFTTQYHMQPAQPVQQPVQRAQPVQPIQQAQPVQQVPAVQRVQPVQPMEQTQSMQQVRQQAPIGRQQQSVNTSLSSRPTPLPRAIDLTRSQSSGNGVTPDQPTSSRTSAQNNGRRTNLNSVQSADASLETVERALGDLRVTNSPAQANGNWRSGPKRAGSGRQDLKAAEIKVPTTDFDFASSNARFDKTAITSTEDKVDGSISRGRIDSEGASPAPEGNNGELSESVSPASGKEKDEDKAYNPKKSFFDSLSSSAGAVLPPTQGRGGAGRRGLGRTRREEERERNVATFGEPGGVGLMGPGAYVGGWGGYGRRGGTGRGGGRGGGRRGAAIAGER